MVWVYFIVGSACVMEDHWRMIEDRMRAMGMKSGVGAWEGAVKVLQGMWNAGEGLWRTLLNAEEQGLGFLFV